jgi:hypothetical protein
MREEAIVIASRTTWTGRYVSYPGVARVLRNQSAKIGAPSARRVPARQLAVHIGADLVAFAADRGAEVEA